MNKGTLIIVGLLVIVVSLFTWQKMTDPSRPLVKAWAAAGIDCLPNGHANVSQHIHAKLSVFIDGAQEMIPANVGIAGGCMSETHTHDASGTIHIESLYRDDTFTLAQFFMVWDQPTEHDGMTAHVLVNGEEVADGFQHVFMDGEVIEVRFEKIAE